jgi:hypothetical protein
VVAAQTWNEVHYGEDTIILAICFTDANNGFFPWGDSDGSVGMKITSDGGKTFKSVPATKFSSLLMDATCAGKNGVVGGMMDTQWSKDGWMTWNVSKGDKFITQNAATIKGKKDDQFFGLAGTDIKGLDGVAVSVDGAQNFKFYNITALKTIARYGSFPSRNVWYISAGMWADSDAEDPTVAHKMSKYLHVHKNGKRSLKVGAQPQAPTPGPTPGWIGQIVTTKDAGKTWTSSFVDEGNLYFNDIDCGSETSCCASADGVAGSYIYCTNDGNTWTQKLFNAGSANSLMAMYALSPTEYWAGGGELDSKFMGAFLHSTDGGNTWTNQTIHNIYVADLDFGDQTHGWAATLDRNSQSGLANFGY